MSFCASFGKGRLLKKCFESQFLEPGLLWCYCHVGSLFLRLTGRTLNLNPSRKYSFCFKDFFGCLSVFIQELCNEKNRRNISVGLGNTCISSTCIVFVHGYCTGTYIT